MLVFIYKGSKDMTTGITESYYFQLLHFCWMPPGKANKYLHQPCIARKYSLGYTFSSNNLLVYFYFLSN